MKLPIAAVLILALVPVSALAAPDARASREIDHLLVFVAASPCKFVRGGTEYDGKAARDHLAMKLDFARSMIDSADAFVDKLASASSTTGVAYKVRCGTRELTSQAWLRTELDDFRRTGK